MDDRITIIHGPNGYGKTFLLKMLDALFNCRYQELRVVPFREFSVTLDDKSLIRVVNRMRLANGRRTRRRLTGLVIEHRRPGSRAEVFKPQDITPEELPFPLGMLEEFLPSLRRTGGTSWLHIPTGETLSLNDVLYKFSHVLPGPYRGRLPDAMLARAPAWLRAISKAIPTRFIQAQRLLAMSGGPQRGREEQGAMVPAVTKYSEELVGAIQKNLAEYASLSQSLDRTFPTRLVKGKAVPGLTIERLRGELRALQEKRSRLMAAGLLDREKEIDVKDLKGVDASKRDVLSVYVDDVKRKLGVFDELTNKIDLLVKILNRRFLYKHVSIDKKDGFVFRTLEGKVLQPTSLSSGEQHELVMLYELLFKVSPNSLILVDEPELSLHVVWQQQFLKDIQDIIKLAGFDVLIATHSPQIIHNRWDLTVELKGPAECSST